VAFISDDELLVSLAASLKTDPAQLSAAGWDSIVAESNNSAYQDIVGALSDRGYSAAQIAAWDRRTEYERDIGLFWCLTKGAGLHGNDPTFIFKLDRRAELATVAVLIGGVIVDPDGTTSGVVGYGTLDTTGDRFSRESTW
jgi:hypothetical protein